MVLENNKPRFCRNLFFQIAALAACLILSSCDDGRDKIYGPKQYKLVLEYDGVTANTDTVTLVAEGHTRVLPPGEFVKIPAQGIKFSFVYAGKEAEHMIIKTCSLDDTYLPLENPDCVVIKPIKAIQPQERIYITFMPNTSGKPRLGIFDLFGDGDKEHFIMTIGSFMFFQESMPED